MLKKVHHIKLFDIDEQQEKKKTVLYLYLLVANPKEF